MDTPTLNLHKTKCLCYPGNSDINSTSNPTEPRIGLDDYNGEKVIIKYLDPGIIEDDKENTNIYIPTDSTQYISLDNINK